MEQRFDGEVSQVAGNNVINQNHIVNIHLPPVAGAEVDTAAIHRRAVRELLQTCSSAECRKAIERISYKLFGGSLFKSLSLDELEKLQIIAKEMNLIEAANKRHSYSVGDGFFARSKHLILNLVFFRKAK